MQNLPVVHSMYEAFGRGDVPALLANCHPDLEWVNPGPTDVPYFGTHRGHAAIVRNVFAFLAENMQFDVFAPRDFLTSGDKVVVLLDITARVGRDKTPITQEVVHVFTFRDGKVVRFHDFQDNHAVAQALR